MAKEKPIEQQIAECASSLLREIAIWEHIRQYGCQDPFNTDGENMNLTRNHVLAYKMDIEELCGDSLPYPEEYYLPTPPEVDTNYMAKEGKYYESRVKQIFFEDDEEPVTKMPEGYDTMRQGGLFMEAD